MDSFFQREREEGGKGSVSDGRGGGGGGGVKGGQGWMECEVPQEGLLKGSWQNYY